MRTNRNLHVLLLIMVVLFVVTVVAPWAQAAAETVTTTSVTPDVIKTLFDANAIIIIFVWGLLCKYLPALARVPNALIPWAGVIGYIAVRLGGQALVGDAHASAGVAAVVPDLVGVIIGGFTSATWARQLYEGWGRGFLEGLLQRRKAEPKRY